MVRIGVDQSLYITMYDPKSATDYMCTGYDLRQLNQFSNKASSMEYEVAAWLKEHKASFKLGEPITPRLVLKVTASVAVLFSQRRTALFCLTECA